MQTQRRNTGEKCNPHGERGPNRDGEPPDGTARSISEKDGITLWDHVRQKGQNRPKLPHVSKMAKTFLPKRRKSKNERSPRVCEAELQISCQIVSQMTRPPQPGQDRLPRHIAPHSEGWRASVGNSTVQATARVARMSTLRLFWDRFGLPPPETRSKLRSSVSELLVETAAAPPSISEASYPE